MAEAAVNCPRGVMFEEVWAILKETAERQKETDRIVKETAERQKETDRQMKETDRKLEAIGENFGNFTNNFGDVVEYMVAPNLLDKLNDLGFDFHTVSSNFKANDKKNNIRFQVDVFLQNGDTAMLVEIKTKLTISDINEHIKRMEKMRMFADLRGDKRVFLGAVAGVVVESDEREYALKNGFYLIESSGETFNITPPDKHKEW